MKVGLYIRLFGRPGTDPAPPAWASIRAQALAAEAAGFDLVVLEDGLLYPEDDGNLGLWESTTVAAAIAASTSTIGIGHAVINNPYRHPARMAGIAATLDEVSSGRYTLGIGLGNTPDDYPLFGIPADRRYTRFAESIQIIQSLLKTGRADFVGEFYQVPEAQLILRGPRPEGPPIVIAGGKPKMIGLAARYADEWNWWVGDSAAVATLPRLVDEVQRACEALGRDPSTLRRSVDVFDVLAPGVHHSLSDDVLPISGSPTEAAEALLSYGSLGFDEVRCNLRAPSDMAKTDAIAWMGEVVTLLHAA